MSDRRQCVRDRLWCRTRRRTAPQLTHTHPNGGTLEPSRIGYGRYATTAKGHRFGGCPQPAPSLIQIRAQRLELRPDLCHILHACMSPVHPVPVNLLPDGSLAPGVRKCWEGMPTWNPVEGTCSRTVCNNAAIKD